MLWSEIMLMMAAVRNQERLLRETASFVAYPVANGVRITAKDGNSMPRSRIVAQETWSQLSRMSDAEFDGSIVLELGVGTFQRGERARVPGEY